MLRCNIAHTIAIWRTDIAGIFCQWYIQTPSNTHANVVDVSHVCVSVCSLVHFHGRYVWWYAYERIYWRAYNYICTTTRTCYCCVAVDVNACVIGLYNLFVWKLWRKNKNRFCSPFVVNVQSHRHVNSNVTGIDLAFVCCVVGFFLRAHSIW